MRKCILILAFTLFPFSAYAVSLNDFDGKWNVDLVTTVKKTPGLNPDDELMSLVFVIDAKAKTMRSEFSGRPGAPVAFTVERENPSEVVVRRVDGKRLRLQPHGNGQLAVSELKDQESLSTMYFTRQKESMAPRQRVLDKRLPPRPRPALPPSAKQKP